MLQKLKCPKCMNEKRLKTLKENPGQMTCMSCGYADEPAKFLKDVITKTKK